MGNELSAAIERDAQRTRARQLHIDTEWLKRLKLQEEEKTGPIYEQVKANIEADCACYNPFILISENQRKKCLAARMRQLVAISERAMYDRAFKEEMRIATKDM